MEISNVNCELLKIESSTYRSMKLAGLIDQIIVEGEINQGTTYSKTIDLSTNVEQWRVSGLPFSSTKLITGIYIKNIITQVEYNLVNSGYLTVASESDIATLKLYIAARLEALGITGAVQSHAVAYENDNPLDDAISFTYYIRNLPDYIAMVKIEYNESGIVTNELFSLTSDDSIIVGNEYILIEPGFFGLTAFEDSIVHIKLSIVSTTGGLKYEEGCYFFDCTFKCRLPDILDESCLTNKDLHLVMLHYSLTQASNCECDCSKMYSVFSFLSKLLPAETSNTSGCGC